MCGIAGYYNAQVNDAQIESLISKLSHRGPDDQRVFKSDRVGLIHTRLSIIELSDLGAQPYRYEHLTLVFNGEIYNHKEIRGELEARGYRFTSNSDTEVLIKAFDAWREQCVDKFIGMFAFCVYDDLEKSFYIFRDRLGVKPLYYSFHAGAFYFASELKALLAFDIPKEIDPTAISLYFKFGYIPGERSPFHGICKLAPAHFIKVKGDQITKTRYWDLASVEQSWANENDLLDELESLLISSFRYRMVADVPVGVFLSGGIDSSLLSAVLQKHVGGIRTFTIGFPDRKFDESGFARIVAEHLKVEHTEKILLVDEAKEILKEFYSIYDEPFADTSGLPFACISKLAKDHGIKVVLSADGGDELFGGYPHYFAAASLRDKLSQVPSFWRTRLVSTSKALIPPSMRRLIPAKNFEHRLYAFEQLLSFQNNRQFFESYIANQADDEIANLMHGLKPPALGILGTEGSMFHDMMDWDLRHYLPDDLLVKVDRASMHYGIESRDPFLDHRLIEFSSRIPMAIKLKDGTPKYLLKRLLSRYYPEKLFDRPKKGFSIPMFQWFSNDIDRLFDQTLSDSVLADIPFINKKEVLREVNKYRLYKKSGKEYNIEKMWRLLSFVLWYRRWAN
ncbi:MAG: asparagine synthase (glutamine-hydrolyzing) [Chryseolinea sp.]